MAREQRPVFYSAARVESYTDAVIAIAATLLVLDLTTTALGTVDSDASLWAALGGMWPNFLSFAISFALLSGLWVIHMTQFRLIARADAVLLWLNNGRLLFIVLIPFTTSLVDEYSEYLAGRILLPITSSSRRRWASPRGRGPPRRTGTCSRTMPRRKLPRGEATDSSRSRAAR